VRNIEVVQLLNRASTDFIALILNVLRIKERLQNDYSCPINVIFMVLRHLRLLRSSTNTSSKGTYSICCTISPSRLVM